MAYKFQQLKVNQLALDYVDKVYVLSRGLPVMERFNLQNQLERAATSIVLNIAEGSTGQSDAEQKRFLGLALRSYLETVACFDIIERQDYLTNDSLVQVREKGHELFIKLQAFRKALRPPVSGPRSSVSSQSSVSGHSPSSVSRPQSSPEGES